MITRHEFEEWIAEDLERTSAYVDVGLEAAGLLAKDIDKDFLTGGTSHVPAVRRLFKQRFPGDRINLGEQLLSIARGLALIGTGGEVDKWAIQS
jgi:hypothetical chaperone protein